MRTGRSLVFVLFVALLAISFSPAGSTTAKEERQDVLYTCNCGPECKCNTVSTKPGNCVCGTPLKWGHALRTEGNEAILCQCAEGCKCSGLDAQDPSKCVCGTPAKKVSLEKTGIYFCLK